MFISRRCSSLPFRSSPKKSQLMTLEFLTRHSGTKTSKLKRMFLWSDQEGSETSHLLMLSESPNYSRIISITSNLPTMWKVESLPLCRIYKFVEFRNSNKATPLYHCSWCYPTLCGENWSLILWIVKGFSPHSAQVPPTPLSGEGPWHRKASRWNKQPNIFLNKVLIIRPNTTIQI